VRLSETGTPNIDRLAAQGHRFDQAITQAPFTPAAHASLFTGLIPPRHGVRTILGSKLREGIPTLAEILSNEGWRCGAVVGSQALSHEYGLDKGFEFYGDDIQTGVSSWVLGERRGAVEVTDCAIEWLRSVDYGDFFLFVHYFDAHDIGKSTPNSETTRSSSVELELLQTVPEVIKSAMRPAWRAFCSGRRYLEIGAKYETYGRRFMLQQVAKIDEQVGRLLNELAEYDGLDNTLVILLADHGDDFWEHGERTHRKYLYDTTLRVPLILYPRIGTRSVLTEQVRLVDVLPTVLGVFEIDIGDVETDGVSLIDLLQSEFAETDAPAKGAYAETVMESKGSAEYEIDTCFATIRMPPWKLIWDRLRNTYELYNLSEDPGESNNLYEDRPEVVDVLSDRLLGLAQERPIRAVEDDDEIVVERLQALGYL
jgi:arylsulfatase A-like enzyme